jgi:sialate O-acetylesterase
MRPGQIQLPAPNQVFQRGPDGKAAIPIRAGGPVEARLLKGREVVLLWKTTETALEGAPAGGPYTLEVRTSQGTQSVSGLMVGDLWLLIGQSNMDGCGKLTGIEPPSKMVHCFYYDEQWGVAKDPLCRVYDSVDPVHWSGLSEPERDKARTEDHRFREYGAGLGVRFGKEISKLTGAPVGLVMCSHGGTSIEQWAPELKDQGGQSLYGSMLRRVQACGGVIAGALWYQGESNAMSPETVPHYKERMQRFIASLRADVGAPNLPFIQVQLSRCFFNGDPAVPDNWNRIQQTQLDIALETPNVSLVAAIDASLSDAIHIDAQSGRRLGKRLAQVAAGMAYGVEGPAFLRPQEVSLEQDGERRILVRYGQVRGKLSPASDIWGFYVEDHEGRRVGITSARSSGAAVALELDQPVKSGAKLWYGRGLNPATNLRDDALAAPVFGPVRL